MMKHLFFSLVFFVSLQSVSSQTVTVEVPTDKKRIAEILKQDREDAKANKLYFAEEEKCRNLIRARSFAEAETSCRLAISYAEKLPKDRYLERSSAYESLAYALLRQRKSDEAISLLKHIRQDGLLTFSVLQYPDEDNDISLGFENFEWHTHADILASTSGLSEVEAIRQFVDNDDEIGGHYPKPIVNILEAHLILLKNAGLNAESAKVEKRLTETKIEFAKFFEK